MTKTDQLTKKQEFVISMLTEKFGDRLLYHYCFSNLLFVHYQTKAGYYVRQMWSTRGENMGKTYFHDYDYEKNEPCRPLPFSR